VSERCFGGGLVVPEHTTAACVFIGDLNRLAVAMALGGVLDRPSCTSSGLVISMKACGKVKSSEHSLNSRFRPSSFKVGVGSSVSHDSSRCLVFDGLPGAEVGAAEWNSIQCGDGSGCNTV